jgi:hypothetical protein
MKRLLIATFILASIASFGQKEGLNFDIDDFNEKFDLVLWLHEYDMIAWRTSDSVMTEDQADIQRLGPEWFCYKDTVGIWHAAYGALRADTYELIFHYTVEKDNNVKKSGKRTSSGVLDSYAFALRTSNKDMQELKDSSGIRFNQFIRKNSDQTFDVWILPAFQPDGTAVYGGEFHFKIDQAGKTILSKDSYYQGAFRGFKTNPPREIWLNYRDLAKPSLGSIFFAWYYKSYFTSIKIDNQESFSTPFKDNKGYTWVHAEKRAKKGVRK